MNRKLAGIIYQRAASGAATGAQAVLTGLSDEESQRFVAGLTVEDSND